MQLAAVIGLLRNYGRERARARRFGYRRVAVGEELKVYGLLGDVVEPADELSASDFQLNALFYIQLGRNIGMNIRIRRNTLQQ